MENEKWHRHIGVYGVNINAQNEILVIIKNGGPYTGLFDLPGGSFENPESITECLKREVLEETMMNIEVIENLGTFDVLTDSPYNGYKYTHHIAIVYFITITKCFKENISKYVPDSDNTTENDSLGFKWININNLNKLNASPLVLKVCEIINQKKNFDLIKYFKSKEIE